MQIHEPHQIHSLSTARSVNPIDFYMRENEEEVNLLKNKFEEAERKNSEY